MIDDEHHEAHGAMIHRGRVEQMNHKYDEIDRFQPETIKALAKKAMQERDEADAVIECLSARISELEKERDNWKANAVSRGKMLVKVRDNLINIKDEIEDEGDRVFFGSTNDADDFKRIVDDLDAYKWDRIMREKDEIDLLECARKANERSSAAEARIVELEEVLRAIADCDTPDFPDADYQRRARQDLQEIARAAIHKD